MKKKQDLAQIDALEIEALTDEELEMVDGGTNTTAFMTLSGGF